MLIMLTFLLFDTRNKKIAYIGIFLVVHKCFLGAELSRVPAIDN